MAEESNHQVCPSCKSRPGTVCFNVEWHAAHMSYDGGWTVEQLALRVRRLEEIVAKLRPAHETSSGTNTFDCTVQCRCGWVGLMSALVKVPFHDDHCLCPQCAARFVKAELPAQGKSAEHGK